MNSTDQTEATFRFQLAILNDDGTIAETIDTDDLNYESALSEFNERCKGYVAEGYDGLSMQAERDPASYYE